MDLATAQCEGLLDAAWWISEQAWGWLAAQGIVGGLGWASCELGRQASLRAALEAAGIAAVEGGNFHVARTPLGQPFLADATEAPLAGWHLSLAHDGGLSLCAVAFGSDLAGLGVDLVHLPRLRGAGKDRRYLLRLARRILPEAAWTALQSESQPVHPDQLRERVAAHFALTEAASKALGTGLRLGAGLGRGGGLPLRTVAASRVAPRVEIGLEGAAARRMAELGGAGLAGQWWHRGELLVGLAVVLRTAGSCRETGAWRAT